MSLLFKFSVVGTLGNAFLGLIISSILHGMVTMQSVTYFHNFPKDSVVIRSSVLLVLLLNTIQLAVAIRAIYYYLISGYLDPLNVLAKILWAINIEVAIGTVVTFIIRGFFTYRAWKLGKGKVLLVVVMILLGLGQLVFGLWISALGFTRSDLLSFLPRVKLPIVCGISCGVACDLLITCVLSYFLYTGRSGVHSTDMIINKLMLWTVNTGLTMALTESVTLITYLAIPNNFAFVALHFITSKVYTNCFLASLNSRQGIRESIEKSRVGSLPANSAPSGTAQFTELRRLSNRSSNRQRSRARSLPSRHRTFDSDIALPVPLKPLYASSRKPSTYRDAPYWEESAGMDSREQLATII